MTYLFKLVRRLAISRDPAMLAALALVAACAGDTTAPESQAAGPAGPVGSPISLQVFPRSVTIETSQRVQFRGQTRTIRGEPVATPLVWRASGGTIKPDGSFLSATAGTFQIFARGRGWKHTDTAVVHVVLPQPALARITVTPQPATVEAGAKRSFTATAYLANGTSTPLGVSWSATGGTVDPSGVYTADSVAGDYRVIAANTAGTIADTADVTVVSPSSTPTPTPTPTPPAGPAAPAHTRLIVSPASISLRVGARQQYRAYGRTSGGDSISVGVTFKVTGGTISPSGLYTAGQKTGAYRVIATSNGISDTGLVTLTSTTSTAVPTPTPVPPPIHTGKIGISFGPFSLPTTASTASFSGGFVGVTAGSVISEITAARGKHRQIFLTLTGGSHTQYKTGGAFDMAKWRARMDSYNTPGIKAAIAAGVADGTVIGNSVMDEPFNTSAGNSWGPKGTVTFAMVEQMCGTVKTMFPTLPAGVIHDHNDFFPTQSYKTCDFILDQYRLSKGDVRKFRDDGLAYAKRAGISIAFSLNILHGGTPGTTCPKYGDDNAARTLCPMSAPQVKEFGQVLGSAGCGMTMWRYQYDYFERSDIKASIRAVSDSLAKLPRKACGRS